MFASLLHTLLAAAAFVVILRFLNKQVYLRIYLHFAHFSLSLDFHLPLFAHLIGFEEHNEEEGKIFSHNNIGHR